MPTRYEIRAKGPRGEDFLIGFTARVSRAGLLGVLRFDGKRLTSLLSEDSQIEFRCKPRVHAVTTDGWTFGFTGRTQREVTQ